MQRAFRLTADTKQHLNGLGNRVPRKVVLYFTGFPLIIQQYQIGFTRTGKVEFCRAGQEG
jgi:hypothetical protein